MAYHIHPREVDITPFGASSKGGQNANRHKSNIRAVHVPTGISVIIRGKAPYSTKERQAIEELQQRVSEHFLAIQQKKVAAAEKERRRKRRYRKTKANIESEKRQRVKKNLRRRVGDG